jgi:hypothetical protein
MQNASEPTIMVQASLWLGPHKEEHTAMRAKRPGGRTIQSAACATANRTGKLRTG